MTVVVAAAPAVTVTVVGLTTIAKLGEPTVWARTLDVDPANIASPEYCAVMECDPAVSDEVEYVVCALLFNVPDPSVVVPSRNDTLPVGATELPEGPITVAVNVTDCPVTDGFAEEVTVVVEASCVAPLTTWVRTEDVEPLKFPSPP